MAETRAVGGADRWGMIAGGVLGFASHGLPVGAVWIPWYQLRDVDLEAGGRFGAALGLMAIFVAAHLLLGCAVFAARAWGPERLRSGLFAGWRVGCLGAVALVIWFCG